MANSVSAGLGARRRRPESGQAASRRFLHDPRRQSRHGRRHGRQLQHYVCRGREELPAEDPSHHAAAPVSQQGKSFGIR